MANKKAVIIGDDGDLPYQIASACAAYSNKLDIERMTCSPDQVENLTQDIISDLSTKIVFWCPDHIPFPAFRATRKDIFLVAAYPGFIKDYAELYSKALQFLKEHSCNLVLASSYLYHHFVVTPEEAAYHINSERPDTVKGLIEMAYLRSHLTFTRSTVVAGESIGWNSDLVPQALREVVNHCIKRKAYKPFLGSTVGHFAVKLDDTTFLTSKRKTNFNDLDAIGLVKVKTDGPDTVLAYGSKPSVGGQSQRIVFKDHPGTDCIVHFHSKLRDKPKDAIKTVSQREIECGSHQCGKNTSDGLVPYDVEGQIIWAVMLDNHGPNIVFSKETNPKSVIDFIERNFDLESKTGGYLL